MPTQTPVQTKPHFSLLATSFAGGPRPRNAATILFGLWFLLFFAALFTPPILDDADATHAQAARAMATTGDLVTLRVDGVRYLEKAPMIYWLAALSFRIFGFNTFSAHLPQAIAVLLLMLLGHRWANQAFGARTGFYTALAVLTSAGVFLFTRIMIPEVLLSLLLCAALFAFLKTLGPISIEPGPLSSEAAKFTVARGAQPAEAIRLTRMVAGMIFASPHVDSIDLEEALRKSGGPEIDLFIQAAREIEAYHGVPVRHHSATGVWNSGAEPSVISRTETGIDRNVLDVIAAIRGKAANQDAVLTWYRDDDGPHMHYVVDLKEIEPRQAVHRLLASGIEHGTVESTERGVQLHIIDLESDSDAKELLEDKLYDYFSDGDIHDQPGFGRLLWKQAATADQPEWTYDQVIARYAEGFSDSPARRRTGRNDLHEGYEEAITFHSAMGSEVAERPSIAWYAGPRFYPYVMWSSLAFAALTKGLVALAFFFATTLAFLILTGTLRKDWLKLRPFGGVLLLLVIAAPWHILAGLRNIGGSNGHGFFWFYFVNEHFLRFLGRRIPADYNKLPGYLYWTSNLIWLFPWTLFLPLALAALWRRFRHQTDTITRNSNLLPPLPYLIGFLFFAAVLAIAGVDGISTAVCVFAAYVLFLVAEHRHFTGFTRSPFYRIDPQQRTILLLSLFAAIVLIFFSLSTNQEYYTFPAYLPLLLLIAATITRAEQTFSTNHDARRWIAFAHAAFTLLGAGFALALFYGLWASRKLPYVSDIGTVLAHRGVGAYTLSLSHFFDLTTPSFAALRLPALLAGLAFAFGPAFAWLLRVQRRHIAATTCIGLTSAVFLFAAHIAFARFAPMLSSEAFAARIQQLEAAHRIAPDTQIAILGDQAFGSSIPFYLGRPVLLVDARTTSMFFGSTFADVPPVFIASPRLLAEWSKGPRKILFVPLERRGQVLDFFGPNVVVLLDSSGKLMVTDRPLDPQ